MKGLGPQAAHSGVLTAAAAVYKDLQRHRILEELLQGADIPPLPGQTSSSKSAQPSHARQSASGACSVTKSGLMTALFEHQNSNAD